MSDFFDISLGDEPTGGSDFFNVAIEEEKKKPAPISAADFYAIKPPPKSIKLKGQFKPEKPSSIAFPDITPKRDVLSSFARGMAEESLIPGLYDEKGLEVALPSSGGKAEFAGRIAGGVVPFSLIGKIPAVAKIAAETAKIKPFAEKGAKAIAAALARKTALSAGRGAAELGVYETAKQALQQKPIEEKGKAVLESAAAGSILSPLLEIGPEVAGAAAGRSVNKIKEIIGKIRGGEVLEPVEEKIVGEVVKNKSMLDDLRKAKTITPDDELELNLWLYRNAGGTPVTEQKLLPGRTIAEEQALEEALASKANRPVEQPPLTPETKKNVLQIEAEIPLSETVYHGTRSEFPVSEIKKPEHQAGIYFTSAKDVAEEYTRRSGFWLSPHTPKEARVIEAKLDLKNPLTIDAQGTRSDNIPTPWHQWKQKVFGNLPKEAWNIDKAARKAKELGHDGLIVKNVIDTAETQGKKKSDIFVVFSGKQVREILKPPPLGFVAKGAEPLSQKEKEVLRRIMMSASGSLAGIELDRNDKGEIVGVKYNVPKGLAGAAITTAGTSVAAKEKALARLAPAMTEVEKKLVEALDKAVPLNREQLAMYTAERAKRAAAATRFTTTKGLTGKMRAIAEKGMLKGPLLGEAEAQKIRSGFASIAPKISQGETDTLFNMINQRIPNFYDRQSANNGLLKLLGGMGGQVPVRSEMQQLARVFSPKTIAAILNKRSWVEKIIGETGAAMRAFKATLDLGPAFRQGFFFVGKPKQFFPAFAESFRYAFDPKRYNELMETIRTHPNYDRMVQSGLSLTDTVSNQEEMFRSTLAERLPGFGVLARMSSRAYSGMLNKMRFDLWNELTQKAGAKLTPYVEENISTLINNGTGRGEIEALKKAFPVLNSTFFAPRYIMSRMNLLYPLFYYRLDPFTRKEALKTLAGTVATAGTVLTLADLAGAKVGKDPRSSDFLKPKIGNTRYDVLGGFQQYYVLLHRLFSGQMVSSTTGKPFNIGEGYKTATKADIMQRFFEGKTAPLVALTFNLLRGKTYEGTPVNVPAEIMEQFIPMILSDIYELHKDGSIPDIGVLPAMFGIGVQTYGNKQPYVIKWKDGVPKVQWREEPGLSEDIANKVIGQKITASPVMKTYEKIKELASAGKRDEAMALLNSMSEEDYAVYEKILERKQRETVDMKTAEMVPVYRNVRKLMDEGKRDEAQKIVDALSDEEYKAFNEAKKLEEGL